MRKQSYDISVTFGVLKGRLYLNKGFVRIEYVHILPFFVRVSAYSRWPGIVHTN